MLAVELVLAPDLLAGSHFLQSSQPSTVRQRNVTVQYPSKYLASGGWKPLLLAAREATQETVEKSVLIAVPGSIPHSLLLPECRAVIHHGGAGTCAAVLTAGLPHLVCPFHFDQFSWV